MQARIGQATFGRARRGRPKVRSHLRVERDPTRAAGRRVPGRVASALLQEGDACVVRWQPVVRANLAKKLVGREPRMIADSEAAGERRLSEAPTFRFAGAGAALVVRQFADKFGWSFGWAEDFPPVTPRPSLSWRRRRRRFGRRCEQSIQASRTDRASRSKPRSPRRRERRKGHAPQRRCAGRGRTDPTRILRSPRAEQGDGSTRT